MTGQSQAARAMLSTFCACIRSRKALSADLPESYLDSVAKAFEQYLDGEEKNIAKSLGLAVIGRPASPVVATRNKAIVEDVKQLHQEGSPLLDCGGAFAEVGERYHLSQSQIRTIYYQHVNSWNPAPTAENRESG